MSSTIELNISTMRQMLQHLNHELTRLESLFDERTTRDDLTGLLRRNAFCVQAEALMVKCRSNGDALGILLLDLDHFKSLNDSFGHQAGDAVLRGVGSLLRSYESPNHVICRFGGEEFAILMRGSALSLAEEIRLRIQQLAFAEKIPSCTASIGTWVGWKTESLDELIAQADVALYRAKTLGRNRVEAA